MKTSPRRYFLNLIAISCVATGYYIIFIIFCAGNLEAKPTSLTFLIMDIALSILVLSFMIVHSVIFSGSPTKTNRYKKIISKLRFLLYFWIAARIVKYFIIININKVHGIMDLLMVHDVFHIRTSSPTTELAKALLSLCVSAAIIFCTETLPIQLFLDDEFLSLFVEQPKSPRTSLHMKENKKLEISLSPAINPEVKNMEEKKEEKQNKNTITKEERRPPSPKRESTPITSISEAKEEEEEDKNLNAKINKKNRTASENPTEDKSLQQEFLPRSKSRKSLQEYLSIKQSLETLIKHVSKKLVAPSQFKLFEDISCLPEKWGKITQCEMNSKMGERLAVRVIECGKLPSYLIENLYVELQFREENPISELCPIISVCCEENRILLFMPKYAESLHKKIYEKELSKVEQITLLKYF